ncbi:MAG: helix-turn-helix transcriptional regulator [Candidatus Bathyarchaeia archaeon]|nr:ArsR family transcriptional regulator [Candidatus Bathyarchaeota archaeon A05DMB-4]MDH7594704.1 ArsR family transcriptional regulator [Candidatus Bathyarchaeota archaeon]
MNIQSERKAYEALSSASRLEILKLLYKKPLSVEEIAEAVKLQPITVRHHLQALEEAGFIENYEEKSGSVGRPKIYYRFAKQPMVVGYPRRRYLALSSFMIKTLQALLGTKRASNLLRSVGKDMGKDVVKEIEAKYNVKDWSMETFKNVFIKRYLEEEGSEPEIIKSDKNSVTYRVHNCLFLELALRMPELMCDALHESFDKGISDAMGGKLKIVRLTCQGHGDPYCEHECKWQEQSA